MTQVANTFSVELEKLLKQVSEDLSQMLDLEVALGESEREFQSVQTLLEGMSPGAVVCRSRYIKNVSGIGGMMFGQEVADIMSRAAMMMDPAEDGEEFMWDGLVNESMAEIWNVLIGSWNSVAVPDYRMSGKVDERAVEHFPSAIQFPDSTGVFPEALVLTLQVGDHQSTCGLFLPFKVVHGSEKKGYTPPSSFVSVTVTPEMLAAVSGGETTEEPSPEAARPSGPTQPVVFLDYSGLVLPWLRLKAEDERLKYLLSEGGGTLDRLSAGDQQPVAAVLAGVDLDLLKQLKDCAVVEIRRRG